MNTLLAVFALVCAVGSVFCDPFDPPTIPDVITPTTPTPGPLQAHPIDPDHVIRPGLFWPLRNCYARHGDWFYDDLPSDEYPDPPNSNVRYFGCKVWRPTWSSCSGFCASKENVTVTTIVMRDPVDCKCCRRQGSQRVKAYPRCVVLRTSPAGGFTVRFETVRQYPEKYRYTLADKCGCLDCGGRVALYRPEEIGEDEVVGRPDPPMNISPIAKADALTRS